MQVGTDGMPMRRGPAFVYIVSEMRSVPDDHVSTLDGLTIYPSVYIRLVGRARGDHAIIDFGTTVS